MATKQRRASRPELERQIVAAIEESGMTKYQIADEAGIERSMLSRFVAGTGGMTVATLAKIAPILNIQIARKDEK